MDFELFFEKLGRFNYQNRGLVLIGCLTVFLLFSLGMINIRFETDPQQLWVSHQSVGYEQQMNFNKNFGAFFRTQQVIMTQSNLKQRDIFDKDHLYGLYFLLSLINKKKTFAEGRQIGIETLCYRPVAGKGCYRPSPLDLWKFDMNDIDKDKDIQYTALCIESPSQNSNIPCSDQNEIPIIKQSIFGGITCDQEKDNHTEYIIPCQHCWIQAKTLMSTYLLNKDEFTSKSAEEWQKMVFIDSIHKFNADNGSFEEQYAKHFEVDKEGNVNTTGGKILNLHDYTAGKLGVRLEFLSERSIPDELDNETSENFLVVIISYSAMFVYIGVAIGTFPSKVSSGFTLAIIGILIVISSVLASMGAVAYLGVGFTMISAEVIPFLILAIGVDNMFIIKNAVQRVQSDKLQDRISLGLREVGPSITTAAICQALAFLVGSLTKMPALQSFCLQAAIAIIFNYLFQITCFVVALIFDLQRQQKGKLDVLFCFPGGKKKESKMFWKRFFGGKYKNLLMNKICFGVIVFVTLAMLVVAGFGLVNIPVGLNEQVSMEVDSDLYNYFTFEKKYIEVGPPAYLVFNNFDYQNPDHTNPIATLNNEVSKLKYVQPPVYSWFASFNNFIKPGETWSEVCGSEDISHYPYEAQLKKFLSVEITSPCCQKFGICGEQYSSDVKFDQNGKIASSRLRVMTKPLRESKDYIRAAREMRMAMDWAMGDLIKSNNGKLDAYPYSLFYVYYDQYSYIRSVALENLLLGLAVVFIAVTLVQNIKIALVICGVVLLTTLDLVGFVFFTNKLFPDNGFITEINAISVVNLITCVGLSVEFTAHVCISMFKLKGTQEEKLKKTLQETGCSVFIGIGLTKLVGVLVLAIAKSTLFRLYYFRMYLGIVILGIFNGLALLPVALYLFGPKDKEQDGLSKETLISKDSSLVKSIK